MRLKFFSLSKPSALYINLNEFSCACSFSDTDKGYYFAYKGLESFNAQFSPSDSYVNFLNQSLSSVIGSCHKPIDVYCALPLCLFHHATITLKGINLADLKLYFDQKRPVIFDSLPKDFKSMHTKYQVLNVSAEQGICIQVLAIGQKVVTLYTSILKKFNANLVSLSCQAFDFIHIVQKTHTSLIVQKVITIIYVETHNDQIIIYVFLLKRSQIFFERVHVSRTDQSFFKLIDEPSLQPHLNNAFWSSFIERFVVTFEPLLGFFLTKRDKLDRIIIFSCSFSLQNFAKLLTKYMKVSVNFYQNHALKEHLPTSHWLEELPTANSQGWLRYALMNQSVYSNKQPVSMNFYPFFHTIFNNFLYQKLAQGFVLVLGFVLLEFITSFLWTQVSVFWSNSNVSISSQDIEHLKQELLAYRNNNRVLSEKIKSVSQSKYNNNSQEKIFFFKQLPFLMTKGLLIEKINFGSDNIKIFGRAKTRELVHNFHAKLIQSFNFLGESELTKSVFNKPWHYFSLSIKIKNNDT